jgi:tetratricopeptide (TPR) repeat protein
MSAGIKRKHAAALTGMRVPYSDPADPAKSQRKAGFVSTVSPTADSQTQPVAAGDRRFQRAAAAFRENRPELAEVLARQFLDAYPDDVNGLKLLADTLGRQEKHEEAEQLLARCIALAPGFVAARHSHVRALLSLNKIEQAHAQIDGLLAQDPDNPAHRNLKALAYMMVGDYVNTVTEYEKVLKSEPKGPGPWMAHAVSLRTLGRYEESVAAYRGIIAKFPRLGEAYWSLANLKTFRFTEAEIASMRALLERSDLTVDSKIHLRFALGKALEDTGQYADAFEQYREGNAIRRATMDYNAELTTAHVSNSIALFTEEFFASRAGQGCQAADPIFVVGMPRSGSTLIEQILSSHSMIEATTELRIVPYLVLTRLGRKRVLDTLIPYPESVRGLGADELKALGEEYLERSRMHRRLGRSYFVDKLPENCGHIGLIHSMLPNAKIIDVRRHPMACCFSCFKQDFPPGQHFSYNQTDLGRYYSDYVRHMAHYDQVLPGLVHRVIYEELIDDPEAEVRRLFDYLGLPFEQQCLRFYENDRPIRTASSEQVRMPIFKEGLDHWRHFEPWLGPLKKALGPVLDSYPAVPDFRRSQ